VVVAVAVELGDGRGGILLLEEVDEGEAAALLRLTILGQVDALDGAWGGGGEDEGEFAVRWSGGRNVGRGLGDGVGGGGGVSGRGSGPGSGSDAQGRAK
jgi:hypothetical protein